MPDARINRLIVAGAKTGTEKNSVCLFASIAYHKSGAADFKVL
jgi:hypothetical protein